MCNSSLNGSSFNEITSNHITPTSHAPQNNLFGKTLNKETSIEIGLFHSGNYSAFLRKNRQSLNTPVNSS